MATSIAKYPRIRFVPKRAMTTIFLRAIGMLMKNRFLLTIFRRRQMRPSMPKPRKKTPMQAAANFPIELSFHDLKKRMTQVLVAVLVLPPATSNPPINMSMPPSQNLSSGSVVGPVVVVVALEDGSVVALEDGSVVVVVTGALQCQAQVGSCGGLSSTMLQGLCSEL